MGGGLNSESASCNSTAVALLTFKLDLVFSNAAKIQVLDPDYRAYVYLNWITTIVGMRHATWL